VDDAAIQKLRAEVLGQLDAPEGSRGSGNLEARVAALETTVARLLGSAAPAPPAGAPRAAHPALGTFSFGPSADRCVMEPDKPCVQSHACRVLGH
jgi:hypothetical protein